MWMNVGTETEAATKCVSTLMDHMNALVIKATFWIRVTEGPVEDVSH